MSGVWGGVNLVMSMTHDSLASRRLAYWAFITGSSVGGLELLRDAGIVMLISNIVFCPFAHALCYGQVSILAVLFSCGLQILAYSTSVLTLPDTRSSVAPPVFTTAY